MKKKCTRCKRITSEFSKESSHSSGLQTACKSCVRSAYRSKYGIVTRIYLGQKQRSKLRGHNKPAYTKEELREWLYSQQLFHELYNNWKNNDYNKYLVPSIDRIDNSLGYSFDNIQLMTWRENDIKGSKEHGRSAVMFDKDLNKIDEFESITQASEKTSVHLSGIANVVTGRAKTAGGYIWKYKEY